HAGTERNEESAGANGVYQTLENQHIGNPAVLTHEPQSDPHFEPGDNPGDEVQRQAGIKGAVLAVDPQNALVQRRIVLDWARTHATPLGQPVERVLDEAKQPLP